LKREILTGLDNWIDINSAYQAFDVENRASKEHLILGGEATVVFLEKGLWKVNETSIGSSHLKVTYDLIFSFLVLFQLSIEWMLNHLNMGKWKFIIIKHFLDHPKVD